MTTVTNTLYLAVLTLFKMVFQSIKEKFFLELIFGVTPMLFKENLIFLTKLNIQPSNMLFISITP